MKFNFGSKGSKNSEEPKQEVKKETIESTACTDPNCTSFYCATHGKINESSSTKAVENIEQVDEIKKIENEKIDTMLKDSAPNESLLVSSNIEISENKDKPKKRFSFKKDKNSKDIIETQDNDTNDKEPKPKKNITIKIPFGKKPDPPNMYEINENYLPTPEHPLKFLFYSGQVAWILYRKKSLLRRKIRLMRRRFFMCDLGLYELDSDFDYKYKKQSTTIYISHGKSMHPLLVKKLYKLWSKKKDAEMIEELKKYEPAIADREYKYVEKAMEDIVQMHMHTSIDLDTEKYLYNHRAYNPKALRMSRQFVFKGKRAVESIYPKIKVPLPWILVMALLIGLAIVSQHLSEWVGNTIAFMQHIGH